MITHTRLISLQNMVTGCGVDRILDVLTLHSCVLTNKHDMATEKKWCNLPSLLIVDIFAQLKLNDIINASSVCKRFRECLFHPRLWRTIHFWIKNERIDSCHFLSKSFGPFVHKAVITFDSRAAWCVREGLHLINTLAVSGKLHALQIRPTSCKIQWVDTFSQMEIGTHGQQLIIKR